MNIELIGKAVASAVAQTGKFGTSEQIVALGLIGKGSAPEDIIGNMSYIGNVSAIRQRLEKCGAVKASAAELDAFQRQVLAALTALAKK
jgi:hypothetical protein